MMGICVSVCTREVLLKPLQQVVNVVEKRQTMPVLANLLVQVGAGDAVADGTDLEVEMVARRRSRMRGRGDHDPGPQAVRHRPRPARWQPVTVSQTATR
jgi:hypothetical protein